MKNRFTSSLIIATLLLAPVLKAEEIGNAALQAPTEQLADSTDAQQEASEGTSETMSTNASDESSDEMQEGTPVGQASQEGAQAAKKKRWQNYALAAGAIAIAVTALILVANNDGHKAKKSKE